MTSLFVVRPQPGCDATLAAARGLGIDAAGYPLFAIRPLEWQAPPAASVDALLIGSANALRCAGEALALFRGKPVYAVGEATAREAEAAGLAIAAIGEGGLQGLLDRVDRDHRRLLRLTGRERITLEPPGRIRIIERLVYASEALPMPPALIKRLCGGGVVLLHSAEAARHFADECERHGIDRAGLHIAALGQRIAAAVGPGWAAVVHAPSPRDEALLALAAQMCQNRSQ